MAPPENDTKEQDNELESQDAVADGDGNVEEEKQPLNLEIDVETSSACERHVTVSISRDDVDRYFHKKFDELMPQAEVPGFRPGRAPRKIVESRFRSQISDQVKGELLLDCMTQGNEESDFAAISEPDFDFDAVTLPDEGPLKFEFDIEVRPEFELPKWKGLNIERPVSDFDNEHIDQQLKRVLFDHSALVPTDGAAKEGDYVVCELTAKHEGKTISSSSELEICVRKQLSFPDWLLENFDKLMVGAKAGETKSTKIKVSCQADNEPLRDQEIDLEFKILDVKEVEYPELTPALLKKLGNFDSEGDLKDAIKNELERQLAYRQSQKVRSQITELLTESANWELPKDLLKRQASRELDRAVMELRTSGFNESMIRAYENDLRQNSLERTEKALKEHFILESIAESEKIEDSPEDYEAEIQLIAAQSGDSPRSVRARLEKRGQMDSLRNQIIERKVVALIQSEAKFKDTKLELDEDQVEAIQHSVAGGGKSDIPEAKYSDGAVEKLPQPADHT